MLSKLSKKIKGCSESIKFSQGSLLFKTSQWHHRTNQVWYDHKITFLVMKPYSAKI